MKVDSEGNVIPEPVSPDDPGLRKVYQVGNPETGNIVEYWFTDADVMSIISQYNNYQQAKKAKFYPK